MPTRITLRRVGKHVGKKAALPGTMAELLELATKKLDLEVPAKCIFSEEGDAYDADDVELIGADDVLYVSCGEAFAPPATATGSPCHLPAAKSPLEGSQTAATCDSRATTTLGP